MKEEEEGRARSSSEREEEKKEEAKSTRKRGNARQKERKGAEGSSTCDSSLHGLYFASWYLYLNSDGVTYEGGTRDEERQDEGDEEARRKERDGKERVAGGERRGPTGSLALCRS